MFARRLLLIIAAVFAAALASQLCPAAGRPDAAIYEYQGDPFKPGSLGAISVVLEKGSQGIPVHTEVFFPTTPGTYVPILFEPGWRGLIYTEVYSDTLSKLTEYGYVVAGVDPFWPLLGGAGGRSSNTEHGIGSSEKMFGLLQWLIEHLNETVLPKNVSVDWNKLGLLAHSAGSDDMVLMLEANKTFAKAVAFLEPYSSHLKSPLGYSIPALAYGTQFCTDFPPCCLRGVDYIEFYPNLACPRLLMNVTGYGHCDILNEKDWKACHATHICKTDATNDRNLYRNEFVPGVLSAFFGKYLQGNADIINFITSADKMPVALGELKYDLNC